MWGVVVESYTGANFVDGVVIYVDDCEVYVDFDVSCVGVVFVCVGMYVNDVVCCAVGVVDVVEIVVHAVVAGVWYC